MDFLIYAICFGVGLVFTLCSAVFGHLFGGDVGHGDVGGHGDFGADGGGDMPGVSVLSPAVIASFITAFGGFGLLLRLIPATSSPLISSPLAVVGGFTVAAAVVAVLRTVFRKTQSSSESRVAALVGVDATIVTGIPEGGVGEISYVVGGTRYTAPARSETGASVPAGKTVKIARVVGTQYYISV